jgi:hypothetical protein
LNKFEKNTSQIGKISGFKSDDFKYIIQNDTFELIENIPKISTLKMHYLKVIQKEKIGENEKIIYNKLFIGLSSDYGVIIFNEELKPIKNFDKLLYDDFTVNNQNEIFFIFSWSSRFKILKYNHKFELIKEIEDFKNLGLITEIRDERKKFMSISSNKKFLYLSDSNNTYLLKFDFELSLKEKIKIENFPRRIQVSDKIICAIGEYNSIYFYDIETKILIKKIDCRDDRILKDLKISFILSRFYIISPQDKKIFCFVDDRTLECEEIKIGENFLKYVAIQNEWENILNNGNLICDDRNFYYSSPYLKCILKF